MSEEKLRDAVNRSGFPLQIRLSHLIKSTADSHGWEVLYQEHAWKNNIDGCTGFIDLIIQDSYGVAVMILEAKRTMDSSWIFLVDNPKQMTRRHAKAWLSSRRVGNTDFKLIDIPVDPTSPESQYCVVDGQDSKARPMLERIASDLVSSTEGFANEEFSRLVREDNRLRIYFNVIVTTARLKVCEINPEDVSITTGTFDKAKFREVPYVRFRKQLTFHYNPPASLYDYGDHKSISQAKESTVFVVNTDSLSDFLRNFSVDELNFNFG